MSLQITQVRMTPGAPQVQASPQLDFYYQGAAPVAPGLTKLIQNQLPDGAIPAVATEWLMPSTPRICGHILFDLVAGGALTIESSIDGVAIWDVIYTIPLIGLNTPNLIGPIEVPGWNIQLRIWNNDGANPATFTATFIGKGM
jgi:hypothetical protein